MPNSGKLREVKRPANGPASPPCFPAWPLGDRPSGGNELCRCRRGSQSAHFDRVSAADVCSFLNIWTAATCYPRASARVDRDLAPSIRRPAATRFGSPTCSACAASTFRAGSPAKEWPPKERRLLDDRDQAGLPMRQARPIAYSCALCRPAPPLSWGARRGSRFRSASSANRRRCVARRLVDACCQRPEWGRGRHPRLPCARGPPRRGWAKAPRSNANPDIGRSWRPCPRGRPDARSRA